MSDHLGIAEFLEGLDGSLHQVVGVGRTLRLGKDIGNTYTLKNSTHGTTGDHTRTSRSGTEQHVSTTETDLDLVGDSALEDGNAY